MDPLLVDSLSKQGVKPDEPDFKNFTSWWVVEVELRRKKKGILLNSVNLRESIIRA